MAGAAWLAFDFDEGDRAHAQGQPVTVGAAQDQLDEIAAGASSGDGLLIPLVAKETRPLSVAAVAESALISEGAIVSRS